MVIRNARINVRTEFKTKNTKTRKLYILFRITQASIYEHNLQQTNNQGH